jgi:hypothetical protein
MLLHKDDCALIRAMTCRVAIECDHGYDVCPICDECLCAQVTVFAHGTANDISEIPTGS